MYAIRYPFTSILSKQFRQRRVGRAGRPEHSHSDAGMVGQVVQRDRPQAVVHGLVAPWPIARCLGRPGCREEEVVGIGVGIVRERQRVPHR